MRTNIRLLIPFLVVVLFLSACTKELVRPSGNITTVEKSYDNYSGLDVSSAFEVEVRFSDTEEKIEIEADDNLHPYIIVEKKGDDLRIKLEAFTTIRGSATMKVYITTKSLERFDISGATTVVVKDKIDEKTLDIDMSGASEFEGEIAVDDLNVDISGASDLNLTGIADDVVMDASGASEIKNYDLVISSLNIELSGASEAKLRVEDRMSIDVSGASTLYYKGDAIINTQDVSGASNVVKVE